MTSDASGGTANVPLSGTGDAVPAADLTLSATSINFGQVQIGSKVSRSLTLTSNGECSADDQRDHGGGRAVQRWLSSLPVTLQPQQQLTLTVTYRADGGKL